MILEIKEENLKLLCRYYFKGSCGDTQEPCDINQCGYVECKVEVLK